MNRMQQFLAGVFPPYKRHLFNCFVGNNTSIFKSFGDNVYLSDIVKNAINVIATESSKIMLKSVTVQESPRSISVNNDSITQLFLNKPNPLMTTRDFFYKVAFLRLTKQNVFIYPKFELTVDGNKRYVGFYPLDPTDVQFGYVEDTDVLAVKLTFLQGDFFVFPYTELIHIRGEYGLNEYLGGNEYGKAETRELLKTVDIMDKVMQGMPKAISAGLEVKGVYNIKSTLDEDKLNENRIAFENAIANSKKGIVALGLAGEFTPVNIEPKLIPADILQWIETKILKNFGPSMAIITGDFTEEQYSAFYQRCIEDFVIQIEQAFSAALYTADQQDQGQRIKVYDRLVQHLSVKTKLEMIQLAAPIGVFGKDDIRELLGYEPIGDNTFMQSLNWIESSAALDYQLNGERRTSNDGLPPKGGGNS